MKHPYPKDQIRCLLLEGIHQRAAEMLKDEGFKAARHAKAFDEPALVEACADVHALGIRSATHVRAPTITSSTKLLTIGAFCIGTNQIDLKAACLAGVPVFNSPFSNTRSVAELTIAEIIALHRRLTDKSSQMHAGLWDKSASGAHEVRGRTLGIVGYGRIGSQVSILAEAMGMRVIFHDIHSVLPLGNAKPCKSLDELLALADVVSLHVPATKATDRLIAQRQLEKFRPGAVLINNARGSVVDTAALANALRAGRVSGAALDVFPDEPESNGLGFVSELRGLPNVILTPHVGGSTEEAQLSIAEDVATKMIRFINNGSTTGAVNVPNVELPNQHSPEHDDSGDELSGRTAPRRQHRVLHFHANVPGVLKQINSVMAEMGVNIAAQYLKTNDDIGYVVFDIDPAGYSPKLADRLRRIPETIRLRVLW